jgi:hypothetical protein
VALSRPSGSRTGYPFIVVGILEWATPVWMEYPKQCFLANRLQTKLIKLS